eukprot:384157-Hanusia_phi.AAC.1
MAPLLLTSPCIAHGVLTSPPCNPRMLAFLPAEFPCDTSTPSIVRLPMLASLLSKLLAHSEGC